MAVELRCPDCRAKLKLPEAPEAGTEVECPKCGTVFPSPPPSALDEADEPAPKKKKKPADDGDAADKPKKDKGDAPPEGKKKKDKPPVDPKAPKKRKVKKKETSQALLIGVIAAGVVMLMFVGGLLYYLLGRTPKSVEMMYYVPDDSTVVQGLNLGHAQKYPEFYKTLSSSFANNEFKAAGDALGKALGVTDLDGLTEYVVFGTNAKKHESTVFRTKAEFNPDGLSKLPGAKQQTAAGKNYYLCDAFKSGTGRMRVFAPTNRLIVVCPESTPDPVFQKIVAGGGDNKDKTVGVRAGELGKRVTRGTFWKMELYEGENKPPAAPAANAPAGGAGAPAGGVGGDEAKAQYERTKADALSGSKGWGMKASIGSREIRFEVIVWCGSSEKASGMNKKWSESDLSKGDEAEPPKWWKDQTNSLGSNTIKAQLLANVGCGSSGELFYAKSSVETSELKQGVGAFVNKVNPQSDQGGGGTPGPPAGVGGPPGGPGPGGPPPGGPGQPPGGSGPRQRRRVWVRR